MTELKENRNVKLSAYIEKEYSDELYKIAYKIDISVSALLRKIIIKYLEEQKW